MELWFSVILIVVVYFLIQITERYIKTRWPARYTSILRKTGLEVSATYCQFSWTTGKLNRLWPAVVHVKPRLWDVWFGAGTWVTVSLIIPSLSLLASNTWVVTQKQWVASDPAKEQAAFSQPVLQPMIPGVNVPMAQLPIMLFALLICSVIHEAGHALAAAREGIPVLGCGVLVLVFLPAAFVSLPTIEVTSLPPATQLRIYTAGIWHNIVLIGIGMALLPFGASTAGLFYTEGQGHAVYHVSEGSGLLGPRGLTVGDVVTRLNGCETKSSNSWRACLLQAQTSHQAYCLTSSIMKTLDERNWDPLNSQNATCCPEDDPARICFSLSDNHSSEKFFRCLSARHVVELSKNSFCDNSSTSCSYCASPSLKPHEQLFVLERQSSNTTVLPAVLFVGSANDIWSEAHVSPYVSKWNFLPIWLPASLARIIRYLIILSGGLALLNIVPCPGLDGQHMSLALINIFWPQPSPYKSMINKGVLAIGTILLCTSLFLGLTQLL